MAMQHTDNLFPNQSGTEATVRKNHRMLSQTRQIICKNITRISTFPTSDFKSQLKEITIWKIL